MGMRLPWRAVAVLAVGGAGGAAAVAVATVPDSSGVIHACVGSPPAGAAPTANLRVIDTGQSCTGTEQPLSWNVQGPPGAQGPPGRSVTVVSGRTLTLAGGQVITVGGKTGPTYTFISPPPRPSGNKLTLGIDGSTLPILEYSFAAKQASGGGGKVSIKEFTITRKLDKSSPMLFKACASGKHFPKVTIVARKTGGKQYLKITLSDVLISSYQSGGHGGQETPSESITLNYTKQQVEYVK